jgi:hypothetical protein
MKWMGGSAKRQCDGPLGDQRRRARGLGGERREELDVRRSHLSWGVGTRHY